MSWSFISWTSVGGSYGIATSRLSVLWTSAGGSCVTPAELVAGSIGQLHPGHFFYGHQ